MAKTARSAKATSPATAEPLTVMYLPDRCTTPFPFHIDLGVLTMPQFPRHTHHCFIELVLIFGGTSMHVTGGERYRIGAGDVFVLQGERDHGYEATENLYMSNVMYDAVAAGLPERYLTAMPGYQALFRVEPRVRERDLFRSRLRLAADAMSEAERLCQRMRDVQAAQKPGWEAEILADLTSLVVFLSRAYGDTREPSARRVYRMGHVLSVLESRPTEKWDLDTLSEMAHMSVNTFLRAFQEATGQSPIQFLLRERIRRSLPLLDAEELSVTQVAAACGFEDGNYFTRQFHRIMGESPRAYRKRVAAVR